MTASAPTQSPKRTAWRVAQVVLVAVLLFGTGWQLYQQWTDASREALRIEFHAGWLLAASALVLGTYLLLIESWRRVLLSLGAKVPFGVAARIWLVSNLGKYVPGKIWTVSAMMAMLAEQGVPLPVSGASAVVVTIANVAAGFAVVLLTSMDTVERLTGGTTGVIIATVAMIATLVGAPILTRQWNRVASMLGREQLSVNVPLGAIVPALIGCAISWFAYGLAFQWLVRSLIGETAAPTQSYVAAYAGSYLVGYLAVFAPGGIGAREVAMSLILPPLGLATQAQAAVITVVSRLWITVVEVIPSVFAATRSVARSGKQP